MRTLILYACPDRRYVPARRRTGSLNCRHRARSTAIIHTTAGDLHCTLFPKVAPIGVENFIGLANGTKDWTSPISSRQEARHSAL